MKSKIFILICLLASPFLLFSQTPPLKTIDVPMESQKAMTMQRVGITDITITYSRPAVKDRKIWGEVVPFNDGKPFPWRAGANESTTIRFTHAVKIEGKDLPAGEYGFHIIPGKEECTLIFSSNTTAWGSFSYNSIEDVLRVKTKPLESSFQNFLVYQFDELTDSSALASVRWEKFQIPFKITIDTKKLMADYIRNALRTPIGFTWQGLHSAAQYCNSKNYNLTEALAWNERSIFADENYFNTKTKSEILRKLGKNSKADSVWVHALEIGGLMELNRGFNILNSQKDYLKAKQVAQTMEKRFPESWRGFYNLGAVHKNLNEKALAEKNFNKALKITTDANVKKRIEGELKSLTAK